MNKDSDPYCPACDSAKTYWAFSTVDGDVWYCGSCGHQWTVKVAEMISLSPSNGVGDHTRQVG